MVQDIFLSCLVYSNRDDGVCNVCMCVRFTAKMADLEERDSLGCLPVPFSLIFKSKIKFAYVEVLQNSVLYVKL